MLLLVLLLLLVFYKCQDEQANYRVRNLMEQIPDQLNKLPENAKVFVEIANNLIVGMKEFIGSFTAEIAAEVKRAPQVELERAYERNLQKKFHLISIPSDGNCLFSAIGLGYQFNKELPTPVSTTDAPEPNVARMVEDVERKSIEHYKKVASEYRKICITHLTQNFRQYVSQVEKEIQNAFDERQNDPTSKLLRKQLLEFFPSRKVSGVEMEIAKVLYYTVGLISTSFNTTTPHVVPVFCFFLFFVFCFFRPLPSFHCRTFTCK